MIIDNPFISGSLNVQNDVTASNIHILGTASAVYFTGSFVGDGTQLSGVTSYTDTDTLSYINTLGVISGSEQIANDISGAFTSVSESIALDISNISTDFADITNKPTLISSSLQFNDLTTPFTGSFTGSFIGDGSQLTNLTISQATTVSAEFTSTTSAVVTHNFNSRNVIVSVYDDSNLQLIPENIELTTLDTVTVTFPTAKTGTIVVAKGGHIVSGSTEFDNVLNKPTLVSSSAQFTDITAPFTGSFTGSFVGDGSNLSGVTSYTDADTLTFIQGYSGSYSGSFIGDGSNLSGVTSYTDADTLDYINSLGVISGSVPELTSVTASFISTGSVTIPHSFNSKNVSVQVYDSNDIYIIPQEIALISNNAVKLTFAGNTTGFAVVSKGGHIVSGSVLVPQVSHISDTFTNTTTHTVNHKFNTKEVIVSVYENDSLIIPDTVTTDDLDNVTVTFPEAISGRVVVVKAGHIVSGSLAFDNLIDTPLVQGTNAITASKHIVPSQDITYDLGSSDLRFRDLYLSSASIYLGNTVISEDNVVTTASLASALPANVVSSSAQIASDISGSFTSVSASIASERLKNTSDTLDGDLTVTGRITAQEFHTEFVSASIIYESGSIQFGDSADDTHIFTGSVDITGSLYVDGQILSGSLISTQIITFTTEGGGILELPKGTYNQRPSNPQEGYTRYNTQAGNIEFYNGGIWQEVGKSSTVEVEYLVIAGGGGGGRYDSGNNYGGGGGGGAGGYRTSVTGEQSGGGTIAEPKLQLTPSSTYTVTVGSGGAGRTSSTGTGTSGANSVFASITSIGGGGGGGVAGVGVGLSGGSGGGGSGDPAQGLGGTGTAGQGYEGGQGAFYNGVWSWGAGGGGAGSPGKGRRTDNSIVGGDGVASTITGTSVVRALGGHGVSGVGYGVGGNNGAPNTGNGGYGADGTDGGTGGSGIVILRYPEKYTLLIEPGLTFTTDTSTVPGFKITTFTAGTGDVTFISTDDLLVQYLVIAGGGGGAAGTGGGGGAGGYRSSAIGENSGGGSSAESTLTLSTSKSYTVTVGAGGSGGLVDGNPGVAGNNSTFSVVTSIGGGAGTHAGDGGSGGSGGGAGYGTFTGGAGTTNQGYAGGATANTGPPYYSGAGGGGAGANGGSVSSSYVGGAGGNGVQSNITGTPTYRAGGGAGGNNSGTVSGGLGGGGDCVNDQDGQAGTANTGGGGAAAGTNSANIGGAGGSGVVILKYPKLFTINQGVGLTSTTSTVGEFKVTTFIAGSDTIQFTI